MTISAAVINLSSPIWIHRGTVCQGFTVIIFPIIKASITSITLKINLLQNIQQAGFLPIPERYENKHFHSIIY